LDGRGGAGIFADYSQWEASRGGSLAGEAIEKPPARERQSSPLSANGQKKLGYIEQREWDGMEALILEAEQEAAAWDREVQDAASDAQRLPEAYAKMQAAHARVEQLYARWAELENRVTK
jgi:ATP-binding cassette subfamily F protein uup